MSSLQPDKFVFCYADVAGNVNFSSSFSNRKFQTIVSSYAFNLSAVHTGNNNGAVTSGPAANWPVFPRECRRRFRSTTLARRMRRNAASSFFTERDVSYMRTRCMRSIIYPFIYFLYPNIW